MNATGARLAATATIPVPAVIAFWWYAITHPTVMDRMAVFPAFVVVCIILGPMTGFGAAVWGWVLYDRGWREVWYAVPGMIVAGGAFALNAGCFLVYIAPGC
jgi:hypothetical protein